MPRCCADAGLLCWGETEKEPGPGSFLPHPFRTPHTSPLWIVLACSFGRLFIHSLPGLGVVGVGLPTSGWVPKASGARIVRAVERYLHSNRCAVRSRGSGCRLRHPDRRSLRWAAESAWLRERSRGRGAGERGAGPVRIGAAGGVWPRPAGGESGGRVPPII